METPDIRVQPIKRQGLDFNGVRVSLPQYYKLKALQEKVLKLDKVMRKLSYGVPEEKLNQSPKWLQLVRMRNAMQKLLPDSHPKFSVHEKRRASHEFNGVKVKCNITLYFFSSQRFKDHVENVPMNVFQNQKGRPFVQFVTESFLFINSTMVMCSNHSKIFLTLIGHPY